MTNEDVLNEFREAGAVREGHCVPSSGLHSSMFLQNNLMFMHPYRCEQHCRALAISIPARVGAVDVCVSPAVGGIIADHETACHLGAPSTYVERQCGILKFRCAFGIEPGARVAVVEDIFSTGLSSRECVEAVQAARGTVVCGACILDRSAGRADPGAPVVASSTLDLPAWSADTLPPILAALPEDAPRSRRLHG